MKTHVYDLDWNRHVTSRTYERFSLEGRHAILSAMGYPIKRCIDENIILVSKYTQVKFLSQQFSGSTLRIDTESKFYTDGYIHWDHKIFDSDNKQVC